MNPSAAPGPDDVQRVLFPTDLRSDGIPAFCHALRIGVAGGGLTLLNVGGTGQWDDFPGIRDTLVRWGLAPPGASRSDLGRLGVRVHKVRVDVRDPVRGILNRVKAGEYDLVVLTTHRREGLQRWLRPSVAWQVASQVPIPCLMIPPTSRGFVDLRNGSTALQRVLVPVAASGQYQGALQHLARLVRALGSPPVHVRFLQVGSGPRADYTAPPEWASDLVERDGDVLEVIEEEAARVDLVVLATRGVDSWTDLLFGSTTQRLLERLSTPVLTVVS